MEKKQLYYDILGISGNATAEEIKRAYVRKGREYANDTEKMILLHQAYEFFRDPANIDAHDVVKEVTKEVVEEKSLSECQELGESYKREGKIDDAIKYLMRVYKEDVSYVDDIKKLARLYYEEKKDLKSVISILNDCVDRSSADKKLKNIYLLETFRAIRVVNSTSFKTVEEILCKKIDSFAVEAKKDPENAEILVSYMEDTVEREDVEGFYKLERVYRLYDTRDVKLHQKYKELCRKAETLKLVKASESKPELESEPMVEIKPEPAVETKPEAEVKYESASETKPEAEVKYKPAAEMKPEAEVKYEPAAEIKPEAEVKYESAAETKPEAEVKYKPAAEVKSELESRQALVSQIKKEVLVDKVSNKEQKKGTSNKMFLGIIAAALILIAVTVLAVVPGNKTDLNGNEAGIAQNDTSTVIVPNLIGMTETEAKEILAKYGLSLTVNSYENSSEYDKDSIMYQSVNGGDEVDRGSVISVNVSMGEDDELAHDGWLNENELKKLEQLNQTYDAKTEVEIRYIQLLADEELLYPEDSENPLIWLVVKEGESDFGIAYTGVDENQLQEIYQKINEIYTSESTDYEKCEQFYEAMYNIVEEF